MKNFLITRGAQLLPLSLTLTLLSILTPRVMAGAIAVYAICVFACLAPNLRRHTYNWRVLLLPALTLAWFALSAVWSPSPRALEMLRDTSYVSIAGTALLFTLPAWPADLARRAINWAICGAIIGAISFAAQYALDFPLTKMLSQNPLRSAMSTNLPKRSACTIALLIWPALLFVAQRCPRRVALTGGALGLLAALILIYDLHSRAALIGSLAALIVFALSYHCNRIGQFVGTLALPLGIPAALLIASISPELIAESIDSSGAARLAMWHLVWQNLSWLGAGLDASRVIDPIIENHPHNIYLQWALEGGATAIILLTAMAALLWRALRRLPAAVQPFIWAHVTTSAIMLAIAYGAWQGWWLGAHLAAAFVLALFVKHGETSPHATSADRRS